MPATKEVEVPSESPKVVSERKVDPELSAMKKIGNIMDDLDPRQARRVLGWALDKYIHSQNKGPTGQVETSVFPV